MNRIVLRWVTNAVALAVAAYIVPGIEIVGRPAWATVAVMAVLFGLVNAFVRPVLKLLTCPLVVASLGLFVLVLNGLMLWLAAWLGNRFDVGFRVAGFWPAFWGALIISLVSIVMTLVLREENKRR